MQNTQKKSLLFLFLCLSIVLNACKQENKTTKIEVENIINLPRNTPESQGISSKHISNFIDKLNNSEINFHSLMIVKNGNVITEGWWNPYKPEDKHQLYSLSKAFTSTAIGIAIKEGLLTEEDTVISFFPDETPIEISKNLAALKVKHLLTMSIGLTIDTDNEIRKKPTESWVKTILNLPIENKPGTKFHYASANTFLLSAIITKLTGLSTHEYLKPRLFNPLHITNTDWKENPQGINMGAFGLRIKTEDIAKLGQLYLQNGEWNGTQIVTKEWAKNATTKQISSSGGDGNFDVVNDWSSGYGYKFWMNTVGGFRADGRNGQFSIVIPEKNLVIAITEESFDMGASMRLVWDHLLPFINDKTYIKESETDHQKLISKLKKLSVPIDKTTLNSKIISTINNKIYTLEDNTFGAKSISLNFNTEKCTLKIIEKNDTEISVDFGFNKWITGSNKKTDTDSFFPVPGRIDFPSKIAGTANWINETTLSLRSRFIENVHGDKLILSFDKNNVKIDFLNSESEDQNYDDPRSSINGEF